MWRGLDEWWRVAGSTDSILFERECQFHPVPETGASQGRWNDVDTWWDTCSTNSGAIGVPNTSVMGSVDQLRRAWEGLASWWGTYVDAQHEAIAELTDVLDTANEQWRAADSIFNEDPLATDWHSRRRSTGPLRINQEENWSQWLAHTIRSAPPAFLISLFGTEFNQRSLSVEREVFLPDAGGTDRYVDILLSSGDRGVSIEVKKGDEHYGKTRHTASLVESQFYREWDHYLLLPKHKLPALRQSFGAELDEDRETQPVIRSTISTDIEVLYWQDVSSTLRDVLLSGGELDGHWEASAFLLCALIEQKIARFVPKPVVDRTIGSTDVMQLDPSLEFAGSTIEEQSTYLRESLGGSQE